MSATTRHSLTGAEACRLLSAIRAILWNCPSPINEGFDRFDPDKDRDLETLEAIAGTLEDAGLAPQDFAPFQEIALETEKSTPPDTARPPEPPRR